MTVGSERGVIGFDRKIRLHWLDAAADWAAQGLSAAAIRRRLDRLLDGEVAGTTHGSARDKTMTVLMHVWVLTPEHVAPLRDDGLALLRGTSARGRLPLHWGMCLATYPFFRAVAETTGRLLSLQGTVALSQIVRRMSASWGARSTVTRATQRVVRSFVDWGVLVETVERGIYAPAPRVRIPEGGIGPWLIEAGMVDSGRREYPFHSLATAAFLFPLELRVSQHEVDSYERLQVYHGGFNGEVVTRKGTG